MKRFYRIMIIVLSVLICMAFMPATSFADEDITIEKQGVLSDGISYKITLNTSKFEIDHIEPFSGETYYLKDEDYKVSGKSITITKACLQGDTGFLPYDFNVSLMIYFKNGDWVTTKNIRYYNIRVLNGSFKEKTVYNGKQKYAHPYHDDLKKGTDYKITYGKKTRKAIGEYSYTMKGIGKYKGTIKGTITIIPKKPVITSAKRTKTTATIKWKKVANCSGYQVRLIDERYYDDPDGGDDDSPYYTTYKKATLKGKTKLSKKFTKLTKSNYDRVWVRSYKVVNGKKYYSNWREKVF